MIVVKKSYRVFKEAKLISFATNFNTNLFLNAVDFPAPPVAKSDMTKAVDDYESAAELSRSVRSDFNTGEVLNRRNELIERLDTQVDYCEQTAATKSQLVAVGLEPTADGPSKAPLPGKPEGEGAKEANEPQSVTVYCKPVKLENSTGKVSYFVYETNSDGTVQGQLMYSNSNSRNLTFGGLDTGKVYYFYIRAKSTAGFGPPSKVIRWVGR